MLDFQDLVNVSHTCTNFCKQIKMAVKTHLLAVLCPFFCSSTDEVLTLLQFGGGYLYGHVITSIFNLRLPVRDFLKDLQVLVTRQS